MFFLPETRLKHKSYTADSSTETTGVHIHGSAFGRVNFVCIQRRGRWTPGCTQWRAGCTSGVIKLYGFPFDELLGVYEELTTRELTARSSTPLAGVIFNVESSSFFTS